MSWPSYAAALLILVLQTAPVVVSASYAARVLVDPDRPLLRVGTGLLVAFVEILVALQAVGAAGFLSRWPVLVAAWLVAGLGGVAAYAIHSRKGAGENREAIEQFRRGQLEVLVLIGKLTRGFDVPEIDSVFLTRPTASPILLAQMIGCGARTCEGKRSFCVLEFTDTVRNLGVELFHAREVRASRRQSATPRSRNGGAKYHYTPSEAPRFETLAWPGLEGISIVSSQTFGVELELGFQGTKDDRIRMARSLIAAIAPVARLPVHPMLLPYHGSEDVTRWRICRDRSCGLEIVSPILVGAEGCAELMRVCAAVHHLAEQTPELQINPATGLHVTLATHLKTERRRMGFASLVTRLEPGLFTLVAPSRFYRWEGNWQYNRRCRNGYCQPLREGQRCDTPRFAEWADAKGRFRSVNLTKAAGRPHLLEIRMHQGTVDARKIIPWISLWMHIFNACRYRWKGNAHQGPALPGGNTTIGRNQVAREDIFSLLKNEGILLPPALEQLLYRRRYELRQAWRCAIPKRAACWEAAAWYDRQRLNLGTIATGGWRAS